MKKALVLLVSGCVLWSLPILAGEYLMNDTGEPVFGLRVVFAEPVEITGFGDVLLSVEPSGESSKFVFSGGELAGWEGHWLNWEPATIALVGLEWMTETTFSPDFSSSDAQVNVGRITKVERSSSGLPYTYFYYVPETAAAYDEAVLLHVATASPPIHSFAEADSGARGQLSNFVDSGLAEGSELIMFSVAVPQYVQGNDRSGCAQVLHRDNLISSNVSAQFYRPDLKFIEVLEHFTNLLAVAGFSVNDRILVTGGSNGGVWAHRFALLHPDRVLAVAAGSHGLWTMPVSQHKGRAMPYHLGISDLDAIGLDAFDARAVAEIPFFVFIGEEDTNDPFTEAPGGTYGYSREQIRWYTDTFGASPQERTRAFRDAFVSIGGECTLSIYPDVGHSLTYEMKRDVINFFLRTIGRPPLANTENTLGSAESGSSVNSRNTPECDGKVESEWETPIFVSTDDLGDASHPAGDITALYLRTDETYLHVQLALAAAAQPSIRYSVNLHPAGSSECYSLHAGGEGMYGPRGFICEVEYAMGEVVEFAVPLDVLRELGLTVFNVSADSRAFGASWDDRYDDIQQKGFRLD